jgi:DNA-binding LacI/PurR family transcriptional regulator
MVLPRPSLRDIARQLNVSHVTVSMALRNHPRISAGRREEIHALAKKLGYRPDPMLSSLIAYRNRKVAKPIAATLAWVNCWPDPKELRRNREFDAYWEGAKEAADRLGYRVEEFVIGGALTGARLNGILQARGIAGLLIPPHPPSIDWASLGLTWEAFSTVRFGFSVRTLRSHMIGNDQMRSSELAVHRMAALGYSKIGFVSNLRSDNSTDGNFRVGYQRGLETLGRGRIEPLLMPERLDDSAPEIPESLPSWLKRWKPDAILTTESGLRTALENLGYDVPGQIGLAATCARDCKRINAGLDQNPEEIGRVAVNTLIDLVQREEKGSPALCRRVLVESRWLDDESVLPAKASARARSPVSAT